MNVDLTFLTLVLPALMALVGFPALVAAVTNLFKVFGWLKDGDAPNVSLFFNVLGFAGVFYLAVTNQLALLSAIDIQLGILASFLVAFTSFAVEIGLTKLFHNGFRGLPFIGYSHSLEKKSKK